MHFLGTQPRSRAVVPPLGHYTGRINDEVWPADKDAQRTLGPSLGASPAVTVGV